MENLRESKLYVNVQNRYKNNGSTKIGYIKTLDNMYENREDAMNEVNNSKYVTFYKDGTSISASTIQIPFIASDNSTNDDVYLLTVYHNENTSITPQFIAFDNLDNAKIAYDYLESLGLYSRIEDSFLKTTKENKLTSLVELVVDNDECAILKVKEDKRFDLIATGYFSGEEEMFRLTKGKTQECTVFNKNGTNYSWHWGVGGHTIVAESMTKKGNLIQDTLQHDLDIPIDYHTIEHCQERLEVQKDIEEFNILEVLQNGEVVDYSR